MAEPTTAKEVKRNVGRAVNLRTALTLLSIAVVFFAGIVFAQYVGGTTVGISVMGLAIIGFLLVAIGRNLRK